MWCEPPVKQLLQQFIIKFTAPKRISFDMMWAPYATSQYLDFLHYIRDRESITEVEITRVKTEECAYEEGPANDVGKAFVVSENVCIVLLSASCLVRLC